MRGMIGKKVGMTRVFDEEGRQHPVTVLEVGPCVVLQRKTADNDGYDAAKCGFGEATEKRTPKPIQGQFKEAGTTPKRHIREFELDAGDEGLKAGDVVTAAMFEEVPFVDITGLTKGKGFQGVVKRHGMSGGRKTHGGHCKRKPGSIGCAAYPGRVQKGKRLPGHDGYTQVTVQNLRVMQVLTEDNLLLVRGAVTGPQGALVVVNKALKKKAVAAS
jgi:large subunit ribosomal protein L3